MSNISIDSCNKIFNHVNNIVEAAIEHGGDAGGPYYNSPTNLEKTMASLIEDLGCSNDYIVAYLDEFENIPKIVSKKEYTKFYYKRLGI